MSLFITMMCSACSFSKCPSPDAQAPPGGKADALRKSLSELKSELKQFPIKRGVDAAIFAKVWNGASITTRSSRRR